MVFHNSFFDCRIMLYGCHLQNSSHDTNFVSVLAHHSNNSSTSSHTHTNFIRRTHKQPIMSPSPPIKSHCRYHLCLLSSSHITTTVGNIIITTVFYSTLSSSHIFHIRCFSSSAARVEFVPTSTNIDNNTTTRQIL